MKIAVPHFLLGLLPLAALGCGLQLSDDIEPNLNTCTGNSDCGSEGACVQTQTGEARCVATQSDLGLITIEVRPSGGTASFVQQDVLKVAWSDTNGVLQPFDIQLPASVSVSGSVVAPDGLAESCRVEDEKTGTPLLPVDVTMVRRVEFGAFASRYEIPSTALLDSDAAASIVAAVPPGDYDMYLQPHALDACTSALPAPQLVLGVTVEADKNFDFSMAGMGAASELYGTLTIPANLDPAAIEGWVFEVLDPTYGYVISNQFALPAPEPDKSEIPIEGFSYHDVPNAVLRLRDLDGNLSVYWQLSPIVGGNGQVNLDLRDLIAEPHQLTASVIDSNGAPVPSAGVTIQSAALTGSVVQNAGYRVDTTTDENGQITVGLIEGTYSVTIVPNVVGDAAYFGDWVVAADPEGGFGQGKAFELVVQPVLTGSVSDPLGALLAGAPIAVGPSQPASASYFDRAVNPSALNRQFSTTTLGDGSFQVAVDPGDIDVSVQMPAESGFPWTVLPSFKVDAAELKPQLDLGEVQLRYPVMLQGYITDGSSPLPYAQVRAWRKGDTGALIQIGAAIADAEGGYVLPLPPGITIAEAAPAESPEQGQ